MKTGKTIKLLNGESHEIAIGDVFRFNFKELETKNGISPFESADFYRSIKQHNADDVIVSVNENEMGFLSFQIDYMKDGELIDSFKNEPATFFHYITNKNICSFLKNEVKEKNRDDKVKIGDVFMIPFTDFVSKDFLKESVVEKLKKNDPQYIIIHIFSMTCIADHYLDFANGRVYALNENDGFVGQKTKEEIETSAKNFKSYRESQGKIDSVYKEDPYFIDYTLSGLSCSKIKWMNENGLFENKIDNINTKELSSENILKKLGVKNNIKKLKLK